MLSALGRAAAAQRKGAKLTPLGSPATQAGPDTQLVLSKDAWQGRRVGEREQEQTDRHTQQRRTDMTWLPLCFTCVLQPENQGGFLGSQNLPWLYFRT